MGYDQRVADQMHRRRLTDSAHAPHPVVTAAGLQIPVTVPAYPSPEDVVAEVLADGRHIKDGKALIGRATRRKAAAVTAALRAAGWRILR